MDLEEYEAEFIPGEVGSYVKDYYWEENEGESHMDEDGEECLKEQVLSHLYHSDASQITRSEVFSKRYEDLEK